MISPVNLCPFTTLILSTRQPGNIIMKMRAYLRFCLLHDAIAVVILGTIYFLARLLM